MDTKYFKVPASPFIATAVIWYGRYHPSGYIGLCRNADSCKNLPHAKGHSLEPLDGGPFVRDALTGEGNAAAWNYAPSRPDEPHSSPVFLVALDAGKVSLRCGHTIKRSAT